jgi:hypothetical protein
MFVDPDGPSFAAQTGMRTGAEDPHQKLVGAIDHASHSLAVARESLPGDTATLVAPVQPRQARVRAEVRRVARLLDEAREPGRISPETIQRAAEVLDRELGLLTGSPRVEAPPKVIETRLEERDGGTWVTGLCPYCWERVAVRTAPDGTAPMARCSNGHQLAIVEHRSAGGA